MLVFFLPSYPCSRKRKMSGKKSRIIWSRPLRHVPFLTLGTACGDYHCPILMSSTPPPHLMSGTFFKIYIFSTAWFVCLFTYGPVAWGGGLNFLRLWIVRLMAPPPPAQFLAFFFLSTNTRPFSTVHPLSQNYSYTKKKEVGECRRQQSPRHTFQ